MHIHILFKQAQGMTDLLGLDVGSVPASAPTLQPAPSSTQNTSDWGDFTGAFNGSG